MEIFKQESELESTFSDRSTSPEHTRVPFIALRSKQSQGVHGHQNPKRARLAQSLKWSGEEGGQSASLLIFLNIMHEKKIICLKRSGRKMEPHDIISFDVLEVETFSRERSEWFKGVTGSDASYAQHAEKDNSLNQAFRRLGLVPSRRKRGTRGLDWDGDSKWIFDSATFIKYTSRSRKSPPATPPPARPPCELPSADLLLASASVLEVLKSVLVCPLTQREMTDPVMLAGSSNGISYDRHAIIEFLQIHGPKEPNTGNALNSTNLLPNFALCQVLRAYHTLRSHTPSAATNAAGASSIAVVPVLPFGPALPVRSVPPSSPAPFISTASLSASANSASSAASFAVVAAADISNSADSTGELSRGAAASMPPRPPQWCVAPTIKRAMQAAVAKRSWPDLIVPTPEEDAAAPLSTTVEVGDAAGELLTEEYLLGLEVDGVNGGGVSRVLVDGGDCRGGSADSAGGMMSGSGGDEEAAIPVPPLCCARGLGGISDVWAEPEGYHVGGGCFGGDGGGECREGSPEPAALPS